MATVTVSSTNQLLAALKTVKGGDIIQLKAGTYNDVNLRWLKFDKPVIITSADPGAKAVLTKLTVSDSSGLTFQDLEFQNPLSNVVRSNHRVTSSSDIKFDRIFVHGTLDNDPTTDGVGIQIGTSKNVSITNSEFRDLRIGVSTSWSDGITISNSVVHVIREDGLKFNGVSNVLIQNNILADFRKSGDEHSDAIQFFTANTAAAAENIVVRGNTIISEDGRTQGIFLRDETGKMPYKNVTITGNTIHGSNWNAIAVIGGVGVDVNSNTILGRVEKKSWIRLESVENGKATGNLAPAYNVQGGVDKTNKYSKTLTDALTADAVSSWFQQHGAGFGDAANALSHNLGVKISWLASGVNLAANDGPAGIVDDAATGGALATGDPGGQTVGAPTSPDKSAPAGDGAAVDTIDVLVCVSPTVVDRQSFAAGGSPESESGVVGRAFAPTHGGVTTGPLVETRTPAPDVPSDPGSGTEAGAPAVGAQAPGDQAHVPPGSHGQDSADTPSVAPADVQAGGSGPSPLAVALAGVGHQAQDPTPDGNPHADPGDIAAFVRVAVSAPVTQTAEAVHTPIEDYWQHHTPNSSWSLDFF